MNTSNSKAVIAWVAAAVLTLIALVAAVAQPVHWKRTAVLAIVLAIACGAGAAMQSRKRVA